MDIEEQIKNKLTKVWKKEIIRIEKIDGGWERRKVNLGKGTIKIQGITPVYDMIATIDDFGIPKTKLKEYNLNYDQIFEVYEAIKAYRLSVKFLRDLKMKFDLFKRYD